MDDAKELKNEIFSQRLIHAVLWNVLLQTAFAILLIFVIQVDLFHPVIWIISTAHYILSFKMILNIILLVLVSLFQAFIYGRYYMLPAPKFFTRFSLFINMFTLQNLTFGILYAFSGYFTMSLYSSLAQSSFSVLKKPCYNYDGQCLIEQSVFLQFGGISMGLYYFITVYICSTSTLQFPHVYQDKYHHIKLAINDIVIMGCRNAVAPVFYYCAFYFFWGNKFRGVVSDVYSLYLEDPPLDDFLNLLRSGIWLRLWFYASLFFVSVFIMKNIFNIILTVPMKFPIQSDSKVTLQNAIGQRSQFNGILGAQDLRILAMSDVYRRQQIFTLSQPGGHPRNWSNLLDKCLKVINDFGTDLQNINCNGKNLDIDSYTNSNNMGKIVSSTFPKNIRSLDQSQCFTELKEYKTAKEISSTDVTKELKLLINKLCQKPILSYFFGELTDAKLKFLLLQAQPVIWTCEGLAFITAASLKEDNFGIVQHDIPVIIEALINLKNNLEKLSKLGLVSRRQILNDAYAIKMKSALTSSVKRSIYKIVLTFSKYINDIPLRPEIQTAIQPFLMCKEA